MDWTPTTTEQGSTILLQHVDANVTGMSQGRVNDINTKRYSLTVLQFWETVFFLVASQEIICNSGRQQTKSLTKILDENALEYLASEKGFILDRLRLDILTIIFRI